MYAEPLFLTAGDRALVIELGDAISPETNRRVHNLVLAMDRQHILGVIDLIPTYRSLLAQYDPMQISLDELQATVSQMARDLDERPLDKPTIVHVPTLYGGENGPDLPSVAEQAGLTLEEVISVHSGPDYLVYMIGFTPGFPYLGGLPEKLATPRLETPRAKIPAGSVGIAETQTGVYPVESPGGWRLIGRTPLKLFDPLREPPSLLKAGDYVRFDPLPDEAEYLQIAGLVERGEYPVTETEKQ